MGYRLDLPHLHCAGYSAPRAGGRTRDYQADPARPGTVVIDNPHDAGLAAQALGQKLHSEGSVIRLHGGTAGSWDCVNCQRSNWEWVETCPRCGLHRDDGRAA